VQTSATVTVSGVDIPTPISVTGGEYSIGCDADGFTSDPGEILDGETVCVRHTASANGSTTVDTVLTVGNFSATFSSTTVANSTVTPGGGGGSGGGEPDIGGGWSGGVGGKGSIDGLMLLGLLLGGGAMVGRRRQRHN
jgi:hypothetical protein